MELKEDIVVTPHSPRASVKIPDNESRSLDKRLAAAQKDLPSACGRREIFGIETTFCS
jgi:hypothetical protein